MRDRRQNSAIDRSKLARRAKPLGALITATAHAKARGDVPPPPVITGSKTANRTRKAATSKEAPVLRACLKWLKKKGVWAYRQNTGTLWAGGQPISFGCPGAGDITGILPDGRRLEVECKSPTGRQSAKQKEFEARIKENNGVYILARSVEDLERVLG